MKTAFVLSVLFVFAVVARVPEYKVSVPKGFSSVAPRLVTWMVQSGMGGDSWVLRFSSDAGCGRCSILTDPKMKMWPVLCNICVTPFWNHMRLVKHCEKCRNKNKDCKKCQRKLQELNALEVTRMNKLALPYLQNIQYA